MAIKLKIPVQIAPPGALRQRIYVETEVTLTGVSGDSEVVITYSTRGESKARGYRVVQGSERSETLKAGTHTLGHWFVLDGPGKPNVVETRVEARRVGGKTTSRGFAVLLA